MIVFYAAISSKNHLLLYQSHVKYGSATQVANKTETFARKAISVNNAAKNLKYGLFIKA